MSLQSICYVQQKLLQGTRNKIVDTVDHITSPVVISQYTPVLFHMPVQPELLRMAVMQRVCGMGLLRRGIRCWSGRMG